MKYISLLRGINVGGQRKILMADLKVLYEGLGCENVVTYIQSGNIIFDSPNPDKTDIATRIEMAIQVQYYFQVPVVLRSAEEFHTLLSQCPYKHIDPDQGGSIVMLTFLSAKPSAQGWTEIQSYLKDSEKMELGDRVIYAHFPEGYGKTKLSNDFMERKLGVRATTRNWRTVSKLQDLMTD